MLLLQVDDVRSSIEESVTDETEQNHHDTHNNVANHNHK